ncbi:MAG: hypothetical protein PVG99_15295 [Desulfobacteraceae bacterium]
MRKKGRGRFWWVLIILLVVGAAILAGYFLGREILHEEPEKAISEKAEPGKEAEVPPSEKEPAEAKAPVVSEEIKEEVKQKIEEPKPLEPEDYCAQIENDILAFFTYLDKKPYIQHIEDGANTYDHFKALIKRLSSRLPIPAGEGIDSVLMTKNVFHFYRVLNKNDIRLIKEILMNESDTLEINLDLFYKWLMLGDRCPDPEGIRPSLEVLYHYAGFFLNTIGGRAYLFRRSLGLRLLCSYYCLLIVYEADKMGKNSYGIDIFPLIAPLGKEIVVYPGFHFKNEYIHKLNELEKYYLQRR